MKPLSVLVGADFPPQLRIILQSTGLKKHLDTDHDTYNLPKADLYLDARTLPDTSNYLGFAAKGETSAAQGFQEEVAGEALDAFENEVIESLKHIPARRKNRSDKTATDPYTAPFVVMCFCAHGVHRSVALKNILKQRLIARGFKVKME